jgi:hypothetical protein
MDDNHDDEVVSTPNPWNDGWEPAGRWVRGAARYSDVPVVKIDEARQLVIVSGDLTHQHADADRVRRALLACDAEVGEEFGVFGNELGDLIVVRPDEEFPGGDDIRFEVYAQVNEYPESVADIVENLTGVIARVVRANECGWTLFTASPMHYGFTRLDYPASR